MRVLVSLLSALLLFCGAAQARETFPAYYGATVDAELADAGQKVIDALETAGFSIIGDYHPEGAATMRVLVFTSVPLQEELLTVKNRALLAAPLKVGLLERQGKTAVSLVNPEYLFRAYLMKEWKAHQEPLLKIDRLVKQAIEVAVKRDLAPFGGELDDKELEHYHYMFGMPYFDDPVELNTFASFDEGVAAITKNLAAKKGGASQVYALVNPAAKRAVFGVALGNEATGEKHFLPIIGEEHLAALPYEVMLEDGKATMLHGRFRIALHWPTLTMGTFTKIMSTPGDVEETLAGLTK